MGKDVIVVIAGDDKKEPKHTGCVVVILLGFMIFVIAIATQYRNCGDPVAKPAKQAKQEPDAKQETDAGQEVLRVEPKAKSEAVKAKAEPASEPKAAEPASEQKKCCKVCRYGQPCGDGCLPSSKVCDKPPGCACGKDEQ